MPQRSLVNWNDAINTGRGLAAIIGGKAGAESSNLAKQMALQKYGHELDVYDNAAKLGLVFPGMSKNQTAVAKATRAKIERDIRMKQYGTAIAVQDSIYKRWAHIEEVWKTEGFDAALPLARQLNQDLRAEKMFGHPNPYRIFGERIDFEKKLVEKQSAKDIDTAIFNVALRVLTNIQGGEGAPEEYFQAWSIAAAITLKRPEFKDLWNQDGKLAEYQQRWETQKNKEDRELGQKGREQAQQREHDVKLQERKETTSRRLSERLNTKITAIFAPKAGFTQTWETGEQQLLSNAQSVGAMMLHGFVQNKVQLTDTQLQGLAEFAYDHQTEGANSPDLMGALSGKHELFVDERTGKVAKLENGVKFLWIGKQWREIKKAK
jgi:hypothetical protein